MERTRRRVTTREALHASAAPPPARTSSTSSRFPLRSCPACALPPQSPETPDLGRRCGKRLRAGPGRSHAHVPRSRRPALAIRRYGPPWRRDRCSLVESDSRARQTSAGVRWHLGWERLQSLDLKHPTSDFFILGPFNLSADHVVGGQRPLDGLEVGEVSALSAQPDDFHQPPQGARHRVAAGSNLDRRRRNPP